MLLQLYLCLVKILRNSTKLSTIFYVYLRYPNILPFTYKELKTALMKL